MKGKLLKYLNLVSCLVLLAAAVFAVFHPYAMLADEYVNLITPAPFTLSVWAALFLLMGVFALRQWRDEITREKAGIWFASACLLLAGRLFALLYDEVFLSLVLLVGAAACFFAASARYGRAKGFWEETVRAGADLGTGWLMASVFVNVSALLTKREWGGAGLPDGVWAVMALLVLAVLDTAVTFHTKRVMPALGVIWMFTGVLVRHISLNHYAGAYPAVIMTVLLGIVILFCAALIVKLPLLLLQAGKEE